MSLPEVVYRSKDLDGIARLYVAYLFTAADGSRYPVLSQDTQEGFPRPGPVPRLDPSLLVEMTDSVSEAPYYRYLGVIDAPPPKSRTLP